MKNAVSVLLIIFLVSCSNKINTTKERRSDTTRDLASLKEADSNWSIACQSKKVVEMMKFYDPNAYFADYIPVKGQENLSKFWQHLFSLPDFFLTWKLDDAYISKSGDIGYTSGVYQQQLTQNGKLVKVQGRYLSIWHKQADGKWKVLVDKP